MRVSKRAGKKSVCAWVTVLLLLFRETRFRRDQWRCTGRKEGLRVTVRWERCLLERGGWRNRLRASGILIWSFINYLIYNVGGWRGTWLSVWEWFHIKLWQPRWCANSRSWSKWGRCASQWSHACWAPQSRLPPRGGRHAWPWRGRVPMSQWTLAPPTREYRARKRWWIACQRWSIGVPPCRPSSRAGSESAPVWLCPLDQHLHTVWGDTRGACTPQLCLLTHHPFVDNLDINNFTNLLDQCTPFTRAPAELPDNAWQSRIVAVSHRRVLPGQRQGLSGVKNHLAPIPSLIAFSQDHVKLRSVNLQTFLERQAAREAPSCRMTRSTRTVPTYCG